MRFPRPTPVIVKCLLAFVALVSPCAAEIKATYKFLSDPDLTITLHRQEQLADGLIPLWIQSLSRPESELRRLAADSLVQLHLQKLPGAEAAVPALIGAVSDPNTQSAALWSAAHALITLDSRDAAPQLLEAANRDPAVRILIEPALAEWNFEPTRAVWRKRLSTSEVPRRDMMTALRCAGRVREREALDSILSIVRNRAQPADIRLAAARAAGQIADSGLESLAGELASDADSHILDRLSAAAILTRHASPEARERLAELARDSEPSVAAAALEGLFAQDPALVLPLVEESFKNRDANVRFAAIRTYCALPAPDRIAALGKSLDDRHPRNRYFVREELFRLATQPEFDAPVRDTVMAALAREGWREQEQASLLTGALNHKPAADRLIALLESNRPEVMASSAWALKTLEIPETLPAMLDKAQRQSKSPTADPREIDPQLAHLFEAMAVMDYQPAQPLLRTFVPKRPYRTIARCGAIYALSHLLKGKPDEALATELIGRVTDTAGMPPEDVPVRQMSAVAIGRMKAVSQAPAFHLLIGEYTDPSPDEYAIRWALRELTGEDVPLAELEPYEVGGWFLEPRP